MKSDALTDETLYKLLFSGESSDRSTAVQPVRLLLSQHASL